MSDSALVIKVGGAMLESPAVTEQFMQVLAQLQRSQAVILVHGGGAQVDKQLAANGMQTQKLDGLRVSPAEQMPIIAGVLAGTANSLLEAAAIKAGMKAAGLTLAAAGMTSAKIKNGQLGHVGEVMANEAGLLNYLLANQIMPVISSIAVDNQGQQLNINADDAAMVVAQLVGAKLVLLSDVPGVLNADKQLIPNLSATAINELIDAQVIQGGMQVKVQAALAVANQLGQEVIISSWQQPQQLLSILSGDSVGTAILPEA
ncbi:acetylglutamate kinase [Paraferrimonas sp. SM1919]|uniref:acetylglutamate kinase n=1 Tax=Paraferrimonas sp. SM1919 TaxID=2662263 RepID=UPI0013D7E63C|nr:acetylglutamate kinase [Paraferrimonas sp. SM1919]